MDGTIEVVRVSGNRVGRARRFKVLIDGELVGQLEDGETHTFAVRAGEHDVQVRLDWTRSPVVRVTVGSSESARLYCLVTANARTNLATAFQDPGNYLHLGPDPRPIQHAGLLRSDKGLVAASLSTSVNGRWFPHSLVGLVPNIDDENLGRAMIELLERSEQHVLTRRGQRLAPRTGDVRQMSELQGQQNIVRVIADGDQLEIIGGNDAQSRDRAPLITRLPRDPDPAQFGRALRSALLLVD